MANIGYPDTKNKKASPLKSLGLIGAVRDVFTGAKDGAAKASPKPAQKKESKAPRKLGDNPVATGGSPLNLGVAGKDTEKKKVNVNRKTKDGGYNSQGVWVKTGYNKEGGGKVTAKRSMKNLPHGSQERHDEYVRRGWAHDATSTVTKGGTKKVTKKKKVPVETDSQKKLRESQEAKNQAQIDLDNAREARRKARKSTNIKDAKKTGQNERQTARKVKRTAKQVKKTAKKTAKRKKREDAIIERGGTRVGAGIRKVGSKIKNVFKKKDKK